MSNYNNIFEIKPERIDNLSNVTQLANNVTKLHLENNKSYDFVNEIIEEMCNLYDNERLKGKDNHSILETLEQFLANKKQNPVDIINICLNDQINPIIQIILASCYYYGKWVEEVEHKAFIYYQKSAEMGNIKGINNVGYCYQNGIGVEKDEHKAFIYYQKSAEMGILKE
ncbi:hypothetical protein C2G38_2296336 [Gigaspora rosea]|uniref:HCP-like protein n=1 Tax=Gigaspora rosea TaxID=44941 RepID=A0A397VKA0_9GLOM|nr:hypothetical protein C2G38_2296336 [Gigaspora rosea]